MWVRRIVVACGLGMLYCASAVAQTCTPFTDVPASDPFCSNIQWMFNRGVTLGCPAPPGQTWYCPAQFVRRDQMAAFMNRLGNITFQQGGNAFGAAATLGTTDGNALRIQPGNGLVGIGTNSPQSKFNVVGTSWFQGDTTPLPPGAGKGMGIGYELSRNQGYIFAHDYATNTWQDMIVQYGDAGRLGIGTTTFSGSAKLEVVGNSYSRGIYGRGFVGVYGESLGCPGCAGVYGKAGSQGLAGEFSGDVTVFGTLFKSAGTFRIDHPLDPANKYLSHSFVESPDMKNIYDGVVTTDAAGSATVELPDWFEALNRDFRYQLTVIGQFAQAIVAREIEQGRFEIRTDRSSVKVSWQVTGIRRDPYANAHRIVVETDKPEAERGAYLFPEGYGRPATESIAERTHPRGSAGSSQLAATP